jgi:hypothetical protein
VEAGATPCATPTASGTTGALTWTLCPDGTLTISGTGAMPITNPTPWNAYRSSITGVHIEAGVTNIGAYAFMSCVNLTTVAIPASVTDIGEEAFSDCSHLTTVTVPASVTDIQSNAFSGTALTSIHAGGATPPDLHGVNMMTGKSTVFSGVDTMACVLYVPVGARTDYRNAFGWSAFGTILEAGETPTLSVSPASLSYAAAGSSQTVGITSNVNWTVISNTAWATVSPASGSGNAIVTVTTTAHSGSSARSATVTVRGTGVSNRTVTVSQAATPTPTPVPSLSVSATSLSFAVGGENKSFGITSSDVTWSVSSSASWLTVSPSSGNGDATVTVTATANDETAARTATVTVSGAGVSTRTVNITQEALVVVVPPTLSVSASSLHFTIDGGTQTATITSNTNWTESTSASWITVSHSGNVLTVVAEHNTGYAREGSVTVTAGDLTQTIRVTQDAPQQIIVEPTPPVNNQGSIEVAFEIPLDEQFSVTFTITLPEGFVLDQSATSLVSELLSNYQMAITSAGDNGWLFTIIPVLSLRSGDGAVYQQLVNIVYTTGESVKDGKYEVKLQDVNLTLNNSGTVIHQDEIKVPVKVGNTNGNTLGNAAVDATGIRYYNGLLTVNTPVAERIDVYSVSGALLYQAQKATGEATFNLGHLPKGVLIVRGGSGWTRKVVK